MKTNESLRGTIVATFLKRFNYTGSNCFILLDVENEVPTLITYEMAKYQLYRRTPQNRDDWMNYQLINYSVKDNILSLHCRKEKLYQLKHYVKKV